MSTADKNVQDLVINIVLLIGAVLMMIVHLDIPTKVMFKIRSRREKKKRATIYNEQVDTVKRMKNYKK